MPQILLFYGLIFTQLENKASVRNGKYCATSANIKYDVT